MSAENPNAETATPNQEQRARFAVMFNLVGGFTEAMGQAQFDQLSAGARETSYFLGRRAVFAFRDVDSEEKDVHLAYVFEAADAGTAGKQASAAAMNVLDTYRSPWFPAPFNLNEVRVATYPADCPPEQVVNYWSFMEESSALQDIFNDWLTVANISSEDIDIFFALHDSEAK